MSMFAFSTLSVAAVAALCLCAGCSSTGADRVSMTAVSSGYTCPLTGEELPCPDCCPLNQDQASQQDAAATPSASEGYVCPLTGEILPCPKCCPLNTAE